jgi:hypothetical protein
MPTFQEIHRDICEGDIFTWGATRDNLDPKILFNVIGKSRKGWYKVKCIDFIDLEDGVIQEFIGSIYTARGDFCTNNYGQTISINWCKFWGWEDEPDEPDEPDENGEKMYLERIYEN